MDGMILAPQPVWVVDRNDPMTPTYVLDVIRHLRERDMIEIFATRFDDPTPAGLAAFHREIMYGATHLFVFGRELPIAVVGTMHAWPGVHSVFAFGTPEFGRAALAMTRFIKGAMIPMLVRSGASRAQCASHALHKDAHRWLRLLGAVHECTMERFGKDGASYYVFRWLRAAS